MNETADTNPGPHPFGHLSDCAVNNGPALPVGPCDCAGRLSRRETLEALLERVRGASGPDRKIDDALMSLTYVREQRYIGGTCEGCDCPDAPDHKDEVWVDPKTDRWTSTHAINFTASIDAALGLVERALPGCYIELSGRRKYLNIPTPIPNHWRAEATTDAGLNSRTAIGWGETAPLAILAALLVALIQQETMGSAVSTPR